MVRKKYALAGSNMKSLLINATLVQFEPIDVDFDEIWHFIDKKNALNFITHFKTVSVNENPQCHTTTQVSIRIFYQEQLLLLI